VTKPATALITGASSGIGEAIAREFARRGLNLVITARRGDRLAALAEALSDQVDVQIVACDLAAPEGPDELITALQEQGLHIDILVNNAGIATTGRFQDLEPADTQQMISLNIAALSRLTQALLPPMLEQGSGRILNVASVAGFQPVPSMAIYAATKAFVLSLTEGLSEDLRGTGVSVTALCPGLTKTEMTDEITSAMLVPEFMMSSAAEVAREGYDAMMNREVIRIPGVANQAAVTWAQFQPRWLVRNLGGLFARMNPGNR